MIRAISVAKAPRNSALETRLPKRPSAILAVTRTAVSTPISALISTSSRFSSIASSSTRRGSSPAPQMRPSRAGLSWACRVRRLGGPRGKPLADLVGRAEHAVAQFLEEGHGEPRTLPPPHLVNSAPRGKGWSWRGTMLDWGNDGSVTSRSDGTVRAGHDQPRDLVRAGDLGGRTLAAVGPALHDRSGGHAGPDWRAVHGKCARRG